MAVWPLRYSFPNETSSSPNQAISGQIWFSNMRVSSGNDKCILGQNCPNYKKPWLNFTHIWNLCLSWLVLGQMWPDGAFWNNVSSGWSCSWVLDRYSWDYCHHVTVDCGPALSHIHHSIAIWEGAFIHSSLNTCFWSQSSMCPQNNCIRQTAEQVWMCILYLIYNLEFWIGSRGILMKWSDEDCVRQASARRAWQGAKSLSNNGNLI